MDLIPFLLTTVSLIAAVGFGIVTWRTLAEDRRRSAARVAALASAIDAGAPPRPAAGDKPVAVAAMFTTESGGSLKTRPLIKAAVVATMAIIIVVFVAMSSRGTPDSSSPTPVVAAADRQAAPLELVSMRHSREGSALTVSGLVRNPRSGATTTRVTAVVFAFDRDGTFVASGRAPLDFTTLEPGDESPFVVTIPNIASVGRYRVSFRTDAGMLRHVDRRSDQMRLAAARRPEA
jgi:hypothetical protein